MLFMFYRQSDLFQVECSINTVHAIVCHCWHIMQIILDFGVLTNNKSISVLQTNLLFNHSLIIINLMNVVDGGKSKIYLYQLYTCIPGSWFNISHSHTYKNLCKKDNTYFHVCLSSCFSETINWIFVVVRIISTNSLPTFPR